MTRVLHTSSRPRHWLLGLALVALLSPGAALALPDASHRTALAAVDQLVIKGRAPMTGYDRGLFGSSWKDVDHNGCDTRDDILRRDLRGLTVRAGSGGCVITSGTLEDPYTLTTIRYVRGHSRIDIDHVVALGDAWQMGAARWSDAVRFSFANDPLNLLAVSASANRQKNDSDAASWLPKAKGFRCAYVARQVAVKLRYRLAATAAEQVAMRRVLDGCPALALPGNGTTPVSFVEHASAKPKPAVKPATGGVARSYDNCTEARAAGVTPIERGTRLYAANEGLDRDGDGVACE